MCLQIADESTRKAAVALVQSCYVFAGRRVRKHLTNIKPAMLKVLHRKFAEHDASQALQRARTPIRTSSSSSSGEMNCHGHHC